MTVYELMSRLGAAGIRLWVEDGQLKFKAPKGALTPELKQNLIDNKTDVIAFLSETRVANAETRSGIPLIDRSLPLPLSHAQQRLWFVEQLTPGSSTFHIPAALILNGILDVPALEQAFLQLLQRHEALRTVFRQDDGEPVQVILDIERFLIPCESLTDLGERERLAQLKLRAEKEIRTSFDLQQGPLIRARLFRLDDNQHGLIVTLHHIVTDGWSMGILVREMAALYAAARMGSAARLPELAIQYADFAAWQRQWLSGDELERQLEYWRRALRNAPEELQLPFDRTRPPLQTLNGATLDLLLDKDLTSRLRTVAREFDATLYVILLAAYNCVLAKWSQQTDLCVGMPIAGRTRAEVEGLIGFFVNTLVIRSDLTSNPSCRDLIKQTRENVLAAQTHQDVPFEAIVEAINTPRNLSFSPLCQVALSMTGAEGTAGNVMMGGLEITPMDIDLVAARLDLTLMLVDHGDWISGMLEYNTDLFDAATMQRFNHHLLTVLESFCEDLEQPVSSLQLYSEAQLQEAFSVAEADANEAAILPLSPRQRDLLGGAALLSGTPQPGQGYYVILQHSLAESALRTALQAVANANPMLRASILTSSSLTSAVPGIDSHYLKVSPRAAIDLKLVDWSAAGFDDAQLADQLSQLCVAGNAGASQAALHHVLVQLPRGRSAVITAAHPVLLAASHYPWHWQQVAHTLAGQTPAAADMQQWMQVQTGPVGVTDTQEALSFWREQLQGYEAPALKQATTGAAVSQHWSLSAEQTAQLLQWCEGQGVSVANYMRTLFSLGLQQCYYFADRILLRSRETVTAAEMHTTMLTPYGNQQPQPALYMQQLADSARVQEVLQRNQQWEKHAGAACQLAANLQRKLLGDAALDFCFDLLVSESGGNVDHVDLVPVYAPLPGQVQLNVVQGATSVQFTLNYHQSEYGGFDLLARMAQVHQAIMVGCHSLQQLPWLFADEQQSLLRIAGAASVVTDNTDSTPTPTPTGQLLLQRFAQQVATRPEQCAVICGAEQQTYAELDATSNQIAQWLQQQGVGPGQRVALCIGRNIHLPSIYLGVIKAGAAYIPLDLNYPADRIHYILDDSKAPLLIADSAVCERLQGGAEQRQIISLEVLQQQVSSCASSPLTSGVDGDAMLYYVYTSGSTGQPKGAGVRHSGEANLLDWYGDLLQCTAQDRFLLVSALGFDLTQKNLFAPICFGAALVIPAQQEYDPDHLLQQIEQHQVTVINCAPSAFYPLLESVTRLGSLRHVVLGGEPIRLTLLQPWLEQAGASVTLTNSYGPTECTDVVASYSIHGDTPSPASLPLGYPCPNNQLYIVNRQGQLMPRGAIGELRIGGVQVGAGYWQREQLNQQVFSENPYGAGQWYRSGDLCRLNPDDSLDYIGRADFQVKLRGLRIEPGEIDSRLKRLDAVGDALSLVINDSLCSYVLTSATFDVDAAYQMLRDELPEFMVPTAIVPVREWPLTPNGKIDRKALPQPVAGGLQEVVAPRNASEQQLADIWCQVLKLPQVSVQANFFELGGHSLLATQVVSRIRKQLAVEISVRALFEAPTIEKLVRYISTASSLAAISAPALVPLSEPNRDTLSFAQYRLWFVDQLNQGSSEYNLPSALKITGPLDINVLDQVFGTIVARHEVLRTNFGEDSGLPTLLVHEPASWQSQFTDLSALAEAQQTPEITRLIDADAARVFDLTTDPLLSTHIIKLAPQQHVLLLNMHHIVSDGWSVGVLIQEVQALYPALLAGQGSPLPPLPIQYSDFAVWQRNWLQGEVLDDLRTYWQNALRGAPDVLRLPTDRPRPKHQTFNGAHLALELGADLSRQLKQFCDQQDLTPFMVLMGAYQIMLARYSGQNDICVGIPIAGRNRAELEGLVGFFINGLVIRTRMEDNPSVLEYLQQVKEVALGAYAHQDMPADVLLDAIKMERTADTSPGAQVGFALQNVNQDAIQGAMAGLQIEEMPRQHKTAKYELSLILQEMAEGLGGVFEYNTDLFNASTIERMVSHYKQLLSQMISTPESMLEQLQMISPADLYGLLDIDPAHDQLKSLSPMQRDMVLDDMLEPGTLKNSLGYHFITSGEFDAAEWLAACTTLARQQPLLRARILRSELPWTDVAYLQIPHAVELDATVEDWSSRHTSDEAAAELARNLIWQPYDLAGNLSQYFVYRLDAGRHLVVFRMNHIILDGAGMAVHLREAIACVEASRAGTSYAPTPDIFDQYVADNSERTDRSDVIGFWKEQRTRLEALDFSLPGDVPAAATESRRVERQLRLSDQHWQQVQVFCQQNRITPSLYFKAIYGLLINAYCRGEDDFYVSEVVGGRTGQHRRAFGNYFQIMPVVFPKQLFQGGAAVSELFAHIRQYRKALRGNASLSLMAQRRLLPQGRLHFMFNYYNFIPSMSLLGTDIQLTAYPQVQDGPVQFVVHEQDGWLQLHLIYLADLFCDLDFLSRMEQLSQQIVNGCQSVAGLELRLPVEREPQPATAVPDNSLGYATVVHGFMEQVTRTPDAIAVRHGAKALSYRELHLQSSALASWLQQQGAGRHSRVAVCLDRSVDMLVAVLGILKCGAAYVPLDANYPAERLAYILQDSAATVLITQQCVTQRLGEVLAASHARVLAMDVDNQWHFSNSSHSQDSHSHLTLTLPSADDSIYIIYTSGSTGKPKGAEVTHAGEMNLQTWYVNELGLNASDRFLLVSAFGFDLTQKNLFAPLLVGASLIIPDMDDFDLNVVAETLVEAGITVVNCAPSAFYPLVERSDFPGYPFPALRYLVLGGEPIRLPALQSWLQQGHCTLVNSYGPTECTDVVAFHCFDHTGEEHSVPLGKAIANTQLYVVDSADHLLPPGVVGELCIGGAGVGKGYTNQPELTAAVFQPNPYASGHEGTEREGMGRWYRTGDLVRQRQDGLLDYIGRKDFQIKIRGLRIELGEIEAALKALPEVMDSLTLVKNQQLVSYVIAPANLATEQVRSGLRARLPDYMIPALVVPLANWPLTPNGKIDRQALPDPEHSGRPPYVAPRNETEEKLAAIWSEVLGVEAIGIHDSFFDLGGHSLLAARAVARFRQEFKVDIQLRSLFELHTIADIARYLDTMQWAARTAEQVASAAPDENRDEGFL